MTSSGSPQFDRLRDTFARDAALRQEVEWAFRLAVETYNPSDRGLRFIAGGIGEWVVTLAAYYAGVVTLPEGHNADHYDTRDLLAQAQALWSVKTSYDSRATYKFRITNGQGGAGRGLVVPTVFLSPSLPGIVYVHPELHPELPAAQEPRGDSVVLGVPHIAAHAAARPECVIPFQMPVNPGAAIRDPGLEAVRLLVEGPQYPRLGTMFRDTERAPTTIVEQLKELTAMRSRGELSDEQFHAAVQRVTA